MHIYIYIPELTSPCYKDTVYVTSKKKGLKVVICMFHYMTATAETRTKDRWITEMF